MKELSMRNGEVQDASECRHDWERTERDDRPLPHWQCSKCDTVVESSPLGL